MHRTLTHNPARDLDAPESALAERVRQSLRDAGHPALRPVAVGVHEGLVTLKGVVESYYLKQLAQASAMRVDGVEVVQNHITVK